MTVMISNTLIEAHVASIAQTYI